MAYLVYHLDTISSLESNIPCILSSCEMGYMPLPAPDTIWRAPTAQAWLAAVKKYRPMTLDEAMRRIFFLPSFGAFDDMHQQHQDAQQSRARFMGADAHAAGAGPGAHADGYNLLNEYEYGPFARSAMVLTLLRGVIDIGEGKRDRGDWRDLTDLWSSCSWLRPGKTILDAEGNDVGEVSRESLRERFALGLQRVRLHPFYHSNALLVLMLSGAKAGISISCAKAAVSAAPMPSGQGHTGQKRATWAAKRRAVAVNGKSSRRAS